ncbi:MAG: hypothetical protein QM530_03375 [Phycisphaerales bacterium]|nr:hypothetical protein [Phycisphaerales bacterium]
MKRAEHIENELNELGIKLLLDIPKAVPFAIPNNYFNELHGNIAHRLDLSEKNNFQLPISNKTPFEQPGVAYFDNLRTQILAKINSEEPDWGKNNPFTIPNNYFEEFPAAVISKVKEHRTIKKSLHFPVFRNLQLAASIALIVFVGYGVLRMNHQRTNSNFNFEGVTQAEISEYVHENIDDFDTDIILNGLSYNKVIPNQILNNQVSNEEIKQYLNEDGMN